MSTIAQRARDLALNCEAKKHAYRQTQDGVVVSFVLHPQEVPAALTLAPLGTRYVLALVEIGDNEEPKGGNTTVAQPAPVPDKPPGRAKVPFDQMSPAQQAGILCDDQSFQKFLRETERDAWRISGGDAPSIVRHLCNVDSRKHIVPGTQAAASWAAVVGEYRLWQRHPELVG